MPARSGSRTGTLPATIKVLEKDGQEELIRKSKKESRRDRGTSSTTGSAAAGTEGKKRGGYEPPARNQASLDDAVGEVVKQLQDVERKVREKRKTSRKASSDRRRRKSSGERKDASGRSDGSRRRSSEDHRDDEHRRHEHRRHDRTSRRYRESVQDVGGTSRYETDYAAMPNSSNNAAAGRRSLGGGGGGGDGFLTLCHGSESFSDMEPPSKTQKARVRGDKDRLPLSPSHSTVGGTTWSEDAFHHVKQTHSMASITICAIQLLVLMLQLAMCGVAPFDVNPMIGPFPDAFSEWGGKNVYLMLEDNQWWRLVTPAFLHVGVLHLLANAFCLLYSSALFEREWGSWSWVFIFFVSEVGCIGASSIADPETIAVGSSGALMGLFAAKLSHTLTYTFFNTDDPSQDDGVHLDQLGSALCSLTVVSLMSSFTYVDWSGHMGGLFAGFFAGILVFSVNVQSICGKLFWILIGLGGLGGCAYLVYQVLMNDIIPDEDLADTCDYFRNLFPENYDCGCLWN